MLNRRKNKLNFDGIDRRAHIEHHYEKKSQLYQLELGIRISYNPDFNVWQVHNLSYPTFKQLRYEIIGYNNSDLAFKFANTYVKLLKYGLDKKEHKYLKNIEYEIDISENEHVPQQNLNKEKQ